MANANWLAQSMELQGAVAVVTGASSGIGHAMAARFADEGMNVVLAARSTDKLKDIAEHLRGKGVEPLVVTTDVTSCDQVEQLVQSTLDTYGKINVMVNNAGNAVAKPIAENTAEDIDKVIDVNLKGCAYGCKAAVPPMIKQGEGYIINIGSVCSFRHFPNYAAYTAAKFGTLGLSRAVYEEVREKGVRVSCICPAAVNTAWAKLAGGEDGLPWPREERLQPDDLAEVAVSALKMPRRVNIDTTLLWPVVESTA